MDERERLAEQLHIWYLEACQQLHPESFNPNAQKQYTDLTEEHKFLDRFIAGKLIDDHPTRGLEVPSPSIETAIEEAMDSIGCNICGHCRDKIRSALAKNGVGR